jgi:hypothetical protein
MDYNLELIPYQYTSREDPDGIIDIDRRVTCDLGTQITGLSEPDQVILDAIDEISYEDRELAYFVEDFVDIEEFDSEDAASFSEGFALIYKLLSMQAGTDEVVELPNVTERGADGFLDYLGFFWPNTKGYYSERVEQLQEAASEVLIALGEHLKITGKMSEGRKAYVIWLGGIIAHDIFSYHKVFDEAVGNYARGVN